MAEIGQKKNTGVVQVHVSSVAHMVEALIGAGADVNDTSDSQVRSSTVCNYLNLFTNIPSQG